MKRVFISFDYDHDEDLKNLLVGQSRHEDSPFEISDWSIKERILGYWQAEARRKIRQAELVIVICGQYTNSADGVATELQITQDEGKPYFLLKGRSERSCSWPTSARQEDKMYNYNTPQN